MGKILAYAAYPGHVFPIMPALLELQRRGHDVALATRQCGGAASAGIRTLDVALPPADGDRAAGRTGPPPGRNEPFARKGAPQAAALDRIIGRERPDLVLVDPFLWGALVAAEASGLPWVAAAHSPMLIPTLGKRLMGPGLPPPRGALDRGRHWLLATANELARDVRGLPEVNALRAAYGLPRLRHLSGLLLRAPLTLAYTAEPLEYPRTDWPPSVRFVGPGLWDPPVAPPPWMDELDGRPLVLVCGSTVHNGEALARAALEGLAAEPFQVIVTLPRGELPESPPANARAFRYVPHGILLPRAACVVSPGGFGIVQKSLAAGVPVVVVPGGGDQRETARRVEVAEAGVRLPPERLTPARLRAAVYLAIQRRAGVERVAAGLRRAGGAAAAADAVESLAAMDGAWRNVA